MEKLGIVWHVSAICEEYTSNWDPSKLQNSIFSSQDKGFYGSHQKIKVRRRKIEGEITVWEINSNQNWKGKVILYSEVAVTK